MEKDIFDFIHVGGCIAATRNNRTKEIKLLTFEDEGVMTRAEMNNFRDKSFNPADLAAVIEDMPDK